MKINTLILIIILSQQLTSSAQLPRLIEFHYESIAGKGLYGVGNKKEKLPIIEIRNDTLVAEFYFSGLPNPINYGVIQNIGDTILLSIREQYNWPHHCRGGCCFKAKYKVKLFNKKHFILDRTFSSFGGDINHQDSIVLCQHQVEIEKQIQKLTTQRISEIKETLRSYQDSLTSKGSSVFEYIESIEKNQQNLYKESNEIMDKFIYLEKVDSFEVNIPELSFSMRWFCNKKRGRVEYEYR